MVQRSQALHLKFQNEQHIDDEGTFLHSWSHVAKQKISPCPLRSLLLLHLTQITWNNQLNINSLESYRNEISLVLRFHHPFPSQMDGNDSCAKYVLTSGVTVSKTSNYRVPLSKSKFIVKNI